MNKILQFLFVFAAMNSVAQTNVYLSFPPKVGGNDLVLGDIVQDLNGVDMKIDDFNWYLSNIHIIHDGGQDLDLSDTVIFVSTPAHTFLLGSFDVTNIEAVNFGTGVPQALNHTDIASYPANHPLSWQDPSMHWGWTAGYKIMLCDGWGDGTGDGNPESVFQLHDLGDANYKYVNMPVIPTVNPTNITVVINCNLDEWIWGVNPGTSGVNHGETGINASTMNNVSSRPVFSIPGDAGLSTLQEEGKLYFNVADESIVFTWKDVANANSYALYNVNGQLVAEGSDINGQGVVKIENVNGGVYFFSIFDENGNSVNTIQALK